MIYLKLDADNETILGHDFWANGDYTVPVEATILVDAEGKYAFKLVSGTLTALTDEEKATHPVTVKNAVEAEKNLKKEKGKLARQISEETLDLIAGWNIDRNLTVSQLDQMMVNYADVLQSLQAGRPETALGQIQAKTADGTLVTEEMKAEIVEELQTKLASLA